MVVPDDLFQGEWHILLRLVLDDLGNLAGVGGRQLYKLGENLETRRANIDSARLERPLHARRENLLQALEHHQFTVLLHQACLPHAAQRVVPEPERAGLIRLELRDLYRRGTEINAEK